MKCPVVHITTEAKNGDIVMVLGECVKKDCAWWDGEIECCSVKALVMDIGALGELLTGIKKRDREVDQFKR